MELLHNMGARGSTLYFNLYVSGFTGLMLDKYTVPISRRLLAPVAGYLHTHSVSADLVTVIGFLIGLSCVPLLATEHYLLALIALLMNRVADGLDGELARLERSTDAGGFLDITLDFIFYAMFPLGFALQSPETNALAAAVLIISFVGTGTSFLAFAIQAEKRELRHTEFPYKGLYYLNGLAEGTETIMVFALMCLLAEYFAVIAFLFAFICLLTTVNRIAFGYQTLKCNP
ncbi:MAG: CDP-alcohol phosphatidyltransferase family protein [Granulosicoccus sp.]|nr:CDP-alcohol phosphatidyltransferase family protein [Granulosicoccus sp.]